MDGRHCRSCPNWIEDTQRRLWSTLLSVAANADCVYAGPNKASATAYLAKQREQTTQSFADATLNCRSGRIDMADTSRAAQTRRSLLSALTYSADSQRCNGVRIWLDGTDCMRACEHAGQAAVGESRRIATGSANNRKCAVILAAAAAARCIGSQRSSASAGQWSGAGSSALRKRAWTACCATKRASPASRDRGRDGRAHV